MKMIILLMFFLPSITIASNSNSSDSTIYGEGRFISDDDDSLSFLKKQLIFSAFQDVITKELKTMGLDEKIFWDKFDKKFEEFFTPLQEEMQKKFDDSLISKKQIELKPADLVKKKQDFTKNLRSQKYSLKSKFGQLSRVIKSYSIAKMTRSPQMPNSRYLLLQAKIDKRILNEIYQKFTYEGEGRHFSNLYFTVIFQTKGMSWSDVGVDIESTFTNVIIDHWKKWIEENLKPGLMNNLKITDESLTSKLEEYVKLPAETSANIKLLSDIAAKAEERGSISSFDDDLWMKITVSIVKESEDLLMKSRTFNFDGDIVLIDLKSNSVLTANDFTNESKSYVLDSPHQLSSDIASYVYRLPMPKLEDIKKRMGSMPKQLSNYTIEVYNVSTIQDIIKLNEFLQNKGVTFQLNSSIQSYTGKSAIIEMLYLGEQDKLLQFLQNLENQYITNDKVINLKNSDKNLIIYLKNALPRSDFFKKEESMPDTEVRRIDVIKKI